MTRDEFVRLVGARLVHLTLAGNLPSIRRQGLLPPARLAALAGVDPAAILLRAAPVTLATPGGEVTLNHQRPLRAGRRGGWLDGMSVEDWARQLDERVFLWPVRRGARFAGSLGDRGGALALQIDAAALFDAAADRIDLSPINSGSALRRPAWRGPWLYVPATAPVEALRENRRQRGLVAGPDGVAEVSVRGGIGVEVLRAALRIASA